MAELVISLNPCSNGIWSLTPAGTHWCPAVCLNPCSNGIWSLTLISELYRKLEVSLNPCSNGIWSLTYPVHF